MAWSAFALWSFSSLCRHEAGDRWLRFNHPVVYAVLLLLMMGAFRWPGIAYNIQLTNPDESHLMAGALTMHHYGQYWGVVDCGSSGPLAMIPLILPKLIGLPLDYTAARTIGLLLLWGSCVFAWLILRQSAGDRPARLLVMPMVCGVAFNHFSDFVQFSSEQAPVFFIALAVWLALGSFSAQGAVLSRPRLAFTGAILSLLPFSKLQAAPFTVCVGACLLIWILRQSGSPWRSRLTDLGWLAAGTLGSLGLMGLAVLHGGSLWEFYQTYWLPNIKYAQARGYPWSESGDRLGVLVGQSWGFDYYFISALILVAIGLAAWSFLPKPARRSVVFGGLLFITGFFVVVAPGREFPHYLQFLIFPTSLFIGLLYAGMAGGASSALARGSWLALVVLVGVAPQIYYRSLSANPFCGYLREARAQSVGAVARHILTYTGPGDTMAVWGWMPTFNIQTQLPQGTRDAQTERQISQNPLRPYFQQRYLADLEKNRPAIFVDAVGERNFGYHSRHADGQENTPWLHRFVDANYVLTADIETSRIYVRKDRFPARPR
jgi:hypothetical protein